MQSHRLPLHVFRSLEQSFLRQLELLAIHCPRICFLGKTGSGKTSLMNAVIGRELLPADDTGLAVTSSVTEIAQDPTMGEGCIVVIPSVCSWDEWEEKKLLLVEQSDVCPILYKCTRLCGVKRHPPLCEWCGAKSHTLRSTKQCVENKTNK